jgi:23S rRNA (cytosine1962-C5)-methyltransferase
VSRPPLLLHEDDHLLVVHKPPGWNTHASQPHGGEGVYEWLRHREPRWADLAILQRLDKETSGVLLFSKSRGANASLAKQFARRRVAKEYVLLSERRPAADTLTARSAIRKGAGRFESVAGEEDPEAREAETRFTVLGREGPHWRLRAEPLTGRSHQIRIHAADHGFPILGDARYGGAPFHRVCLHAARLGLRHPATNEPVAFEAPADFTRPARQALRAALIEPDATNVFRLVHGTPDGWPGWYVERWGGWLLASSEQPAGDAEKARLAALLEETGAQGAAFKRLDRHLRGAATEAASPAPLLGEPPPESWLVRENGLRFEARFGEGGSVGLFPDQRDNRRRLLVNHVAAGFPVRPGGLAGAAVLNVFAYTCGFSVAAAAAGAVTTSLDLSRKHLDWGRRNFTASGLDPAAHDFIYGDAFDWLRRLARKGRRFDAVLLDPPTFSQSREHGVFRAATDYGGLVGAALPVLAPDGVLLASTNAATLAPEAFLAQVDAAVHAAGRRVTARHFAPQPPDFPVTRDEPAHLKTVWLRVA